MSRRPRRHTGLLTACSLVLATAGTLTACGPDGSPSSERSLVTEVSVTMHATVDGAMQEKKSFTVPAEGTLAFASGGNHLMFAKLTHKPGQGEKVSVELHFAKSGTVRISMPVKPATYDPKTGR